MNGDNRAHNQAAGEHPKHRGGCPQSVKLQRKFNRGLEFGSSSVFGTLFLCPKPKDFFIGKGSPNIRVFVVEFLCTDAVNKSENGLVVFRVVVGFSLYVLDIRHWAKETPDTLVTFGVEWIHGKIL